jgi:hypothetical protein
MIVEEKDFLNHTWKSCCFHIDKRVLLFWVQLAISLLMLLFCTQRLVVLNRCEEQSPYLAILSSILSVWLPTPLFQ